MPILHDLQEVAPLLGGHGSKSPVVEDQKFDARQALEEPWVMAVAACQRERIEQSWQALIENRSVIPTGLVTERACNPTLADAILDRLVHNAHRLTLMGESLRKAAAKRQRLDDEPAN
jgi:hypothetical protein